MDKNFKASFYRAQIRKSLIDCISIYSCTRESDVPSYPLKERLNKLSWKFTEDGFWIWIIDLVVAFCIEKYIFPLFLPDDPKIGSFDPGDPTTTNLYLGNLSPKVSR